MAGHTGNAYLDLLDAFDEHRRRVDSIGELLSVQLGGEDDPVPTEALLDLLDLLGTASAQAERRLEEFDALFKAGIESGIPIQCFSTPSIQTTSPTTNLPESMKRLCKRVAFINNSVLRYGENLRREGNAYGDVVCDAIGIMDMVMDEAKHELAPQTV